MIRHQIKTILKVTLNNAKDQWNWFIDDHADVIEGKRDHFYVKVQKDDLIDNEEAEKRLMDWQELQRNKLRN